MAATKAAQDKLRKPLAFQTSDPHGNVVICARSTWESHVLHPTAGHPEMAGRLDDVIAAIENPDSIRQSTARPEARIFEWVAADLIQIRVVVTYDDVDLLETGNTVAKVNSAFPVMPEEYDRPRVGAYTYRRPGSSHPMKRNAQ